jgi:hypothetical protein
VSVRGRRLVLAGLAAVTAAIALGASNALADGDPASDVLITERVFYPYYTTTPKEQVDRLQRTVDAAYTAGYPIRVAVITSPQDLGTASGLWEKPETYARFLSKELAFAYKGRLLIVNPWGFGYVSGTRPDPAKLRLLESVPIGNSTDELFQAADDAVRRLAGAAGHTLPAEKTSSGSSTTRDSLVIAGMAIVVALLALGVYRLRRARSRRPTEGVSS